MEREKLKLIAALLLSPAKGWAELDDRYSRESEEDLQVSLFYPAVGILAALAFVSEGIYADTFSFASCLKASVAVLIVSIVAFYGNLVVMPRLSERLMGFRAGRRRWEAFILFALSPIYIMSAVSMLLPEFIFVYLIGFYMIYVVWQGSVAYWKVPEERTFLCFSLLTGLLFGLSFGTKMILSKVGF